MTLLASRFRRAYGAHPLQLVLVLAGSVLAAYAVQELSLAKLYNRDVWWQSIGLWFVGAAVGHDLVLFPAYAAADRVITAVTRSRSTSRSTSRATARRRTRLVPATNYVRLPLMACGLVTLLFFPGIIRQGAGSYQRATGQTQEPFLLRWVVLCAVILALGAAAYAVARLVASRRPAPSIEPERPGPEREATVVREPIASWAVVATLVLAAVTALRRRGKQRPW